LAAKAATAFGEREDRQREGESERLHAKRGELTRERDFVPWESSPRWTASVD
jgi:hypothetical protein